MHYTGPWDIVPYTFLGLIVLFFIWFFFINPWQSNKKHKQEFNLVNEFRQRNGIPLYKTIKEWEACRESK